MPPTIAEASENQQSALNASLRAGVKVLSRDQTITFTKYVRLVLPLDGFVFWVRADLLSAGALLNASRFNTSKFNQASTITPAATVTVQGSLHYATVSQQTEVESYGINRVTFTALSPIQDMDQVGPNCIFIGVIDEISFAFSQRQKFYRQAGLYHYLGDAIYPVMQSQIIDKLSGFNSRELVVSNSLPIWLSLTGDKGLPGLSGFPFPIYPSFAIPDNIAPPYIAVHITPELTTALQAFPSLDKTSSHLQLASDKVRLTTYGLRNSDALDFQDYINWFSLVTNVFGIMDTPIIHDEKQPQTELGILAMRKTMELQVSYNQGTVRNIARQLITQATVTNTTP